MSSEPATATDGTTRVWPVALMIVGLAIAGLGLLLVEDSLLGGLHIVAIGGSLLLAGLVSTRWAAAQFGLSAADQRRWALAFATLAGLLFAVFLILNFTSFEGPFEE